MIWLVIGILALVVTLSALKWLAEADRKQAGMSAAAIVIALLLGFGLLLLLTGKLYAALPALGSALAGLWRMRWLARLLAGPVLRRSSARARNRSGAAGAASTVHTARLRVHLDSDGAVRDGEVLSGRFAARSLSSLEFGEALALLEELAAEDADGVRLLEAFLDRTRGTDWRERTRHYGRRGESGGDRGRGNGRRSSRPRSGMSREEALEVLGIGPEADEAAIKAAHRTLMKRLHPDQGGSGYFATKLNEARDVLLETHRAS